MQEWILQNTEDYLQCSGLDTVAEDWGTEIGHRDKYSG